MLLSSSDPVTGDNETLFSAGGNNAMLVNGTQICSTGRLQPICGVSDPSCGKCGKYFIKLVDLYTLVINLMINVAVLPPSSIDQKALRVSVGDCGYAYFFQD